MNVKATPILGNVSLPRQQ